LDEQVEKRKGKYKRLTAFSSTFKVEEKGGACVVSFTVSGHHRQQGGKMINGI
jgi:hypothetical protein